MQRIIKQLQHIATKPEIGALRQWRSAPFLMAPVEKHFAIYKRIRGGIIVASVFHSKRDIENIINQIAPAMTAEILEIEKNIH